MPAALPFPPVHVPLGDVQVILELPCDPVGDPRKQHAYRDKVPKRYTWEVEKGAWSDDFAHGCGTDVILRRCCWHGEHLAKTKKLTPRVHRSSGAWRLRTKINGEHVYYHKVAAWAWHRSRYASAVAFSDFTYADGWEGDHLPDARLETTPEHVRAGHVEAVPHDVHLARTRFLVEARAIRDEADKREHDAARAREVAHAFAPLLLRRSTTRKRTLAELRAQHAAAEQRAPPSLRTLRAEGRRWLLKWDIDWTTPEGVHDPEYSQSIEGNGNPYVSFLFVSTGPPRQALVAYCVAKARGLFFADHAA